MNHLKPQDPIDVLKDEWPGCPIMAVRTYNILRRMGIDTIQQLLDVDIDAVVAERNSGHRTVEQVTCYQQQIPASLVPTHQIITFTVEDVSPGRRGFREHVGEGELDNGVPFHLTSTRTALYLTLDLPAGKVEQRLNLEALVDHWGATLISKGTTA